MDFAALKAKAQGAAQKGQAQFNTQLSGLKEKAGSVSVPGRPAASASSSGSRPPPPPAPKPVSYARPTPTAAPPIASRSRSDSSSTQFKWSTISQADKEAFFGLLDQYFAKQERGEVQFSPPPKPALKSTIREAPPTIKPTRENIKPKIIDSTTYPPPAQKNSNAGDFALYFLQDTDWSDQWYTSQNTMPPPLRNRRDVTWTAGIMQMGNQKTLTGCAMFSDLSICNYKIEFATNNPTRVYRTALYSKRPTAMDGQALYEAHLTYGETIATFAENAESSRRPVGRGECWDMAAEALKTFATENNILPPVPSISRTHGHLIFSGKAWGKSANDQSGEWRGGDTAVRRGDVVEWNTVTIREANSPRGSWSTLGDPEHTAVIVEDAEPRISPSDGQPLKPSEIGFLTVIEQSAGQIPTRRTYDLSGFEKGQMWIYRPVAMLDYLGCRQASAQWPPEMQMTPAGQ